MVTHVFLTWWTWKRRVNAGAGRHQQLVAPMLTGALLSVTNLSVVVFGYKGVIPTHFCL